MLPQNSSDVLVKRNLSYFRSFVFSFFRFWLLLSEYVPSIHRNLGLAIHVALLNCYHATQNQLPSKDMSGRHLKISMQSKYCDVNPNVKGSFKCLDMSVQDANFPGYWTHAFLSVGSEIQNVGVDNWVKHRNFYVCFFFHVAAA